MPVGNWRLMLNKRRHSAGSKQRSERRAVNCSVQETTIVLTCHYTSMLVKTHKMCNATSEPLFKPWTWSGPCRSWSACLWCAMLIVGQMVIIWGWRDEGTLVIAQFFCVPKTALKIVY